MKTLYFLFLILWSLNVPAQTEQLSVSEERKSSYKIDWKYTAGSYFIFDCERLHFACVDLDGHNNCSEERKFAVGKKAPRYPCAPLGKFSDKKTCVLKSYEIIDYNPTRRFCYPK